MKTAKMNDDAYSLKQTGDGSYSLYSGQFGELMHTDAGAYDESLKKHLYPSGILDKLSCNKTGSVLDVGFGLGYNLLALLTENLSRSFVSAVSLEFDKGIFQWMKDVRFNDERDRIYQKIIAAFETGDYADEYCRLQVLFGDARQTIQQIPAEMKFDAVFHDPYSPSKNAELWSVDFFKQISSRMKYDAVLTTYSAAPQVRRAMMEAGLFAGRGISTGIKKESTHASIEKRFIADPLHDDEIRDLYGSHKSIPYRDPLFNRDRKELLGIRIDEMKQFREDRRARRV